MLHEILLILFSLLICIFRERGWIIWKIYIYDIISTSYKLSRLFGTKPLFRDPHLPLLFRESFYKMYISDIRKEINLEMLSSNFRPICTGLKTSERQKPSLKSQTYQPLVCSIFSYSIYPNFVHHHSSNLFSSGDDLNQYSAFGPAVWNIWLKQYM